MARTERHDPHFQPLFIAVHFLFGDMFVGVGLAQGIRGPGYAFFLFTGLAFAWWASSRGRPWTTVLLSFLPIIGGVLWHEMATDLSEGRSWPVYISLVAFMVLMFWSIYW